MSRLAWAGVVATLSVLLVLLYFYNVPRAAHSRGIGDLLPPFDPSKLDRERELVKAVSRCGFVRDLKGEWVRNYSMSLPLYNCSDVVKPERPHWGCYELPFRNPKVDTKPEWWDPGGVADEFDTRRAGSAERCALDGLPGTADELLRMLENRVVYFLGDSLMEQIWTQLGCELRGRYGLDFTIDEVDIDTCGVGKLGASDGAYLKSLEQYACPHIRPMQQCCTSSAMCYVILRPGTASGPRVCWVVAGYSSTPTVSRTLFTVVKTHALSERDVIFTNEGVHFVELLEPHMLAEVRNRTREYIRTYDRLSREYGGRLPAIVWRESTPQHFNNSNGTGDYSWVVRQRSCVPHSHTTNTFRPIQTAALEAAGIPIMRVHHAASTRWHEHCGNIINVDYDCTHFCVPSGALRHFLRVALHHVRSVALGQWRRVNVSSTWHSFV